MIYNEDDHLGVPVLLLTVIHSSSLEVTTPCMLYQGMTLQDMWRIFLLSMREDTSTGVGSTLMKVENR